MAPRTRSQWRRARRDRRREQRRPRILGVGWRDLIVALRDWRELTRAQRASALTKWLVVLASAIAIASLSIIGSAIYVEYFGLPHTAVVSVGNESISASEYRDFLAYGRYKIEHESLVLDGGERSDDYEARSADIRGQLAGLAFGGITVLAHDLLIRSDWAERGLEVSHADIRTRVLSLARPTATRPVGQSLSASEAIVLQELAEATGVGAELIKRFVVSDILRERLSDELFARVDPAPPHVRLVEIALTREADAFDVLQRIEAGERMEDLARELSGDPAARVSGGQVDWTPLGIRSTAWDEMAFHAPVGDVMGPFEAGTSWFLLQVLDRVDERPLSAQNEELVRQTEMDEWFTKRAQQWPISYVLSAEVIDWTTRNSR